MDNNFSHLHGFKKIKHKRINYLTDGKSVILYDNLLRLYSIKEFKRQVLKPYGFVYIITNLETNKIYVGKTIKYPLRRWRTHFLCKTNTRLTSSIKYYGKFTFECEVVKLCYSPEQLAKEELKRIIRFKSYKEEFGYNMKIQSILYSKNDNYYEKK